jgi:SPP1 family predicted phage head-tail adaptor
MKRTGSMLRERIQYQERTTATNEFGEKVETWATLATLWASVRPQSGSEKIRADQVEASLAFVVEIRFDPRVRVSGRFLYRGQILHIHSAADLESRKQWLSMACTAQQ